MLFLIGTTIICVLIIYLLLTAIENIPIVKRFLTMELPIKVPDKPLIDIFNHDNKDKK